MRISQLRMQGFKGHNRTVDIGRLTVFTGRNDAGKTTCLQVPPLAILGYVPDIGPKKTARLKSAEVLSVGITVTDDDFAIDIDRTIDASNSHWVEFNPPIRAKTMKDCNAHIEKTLGNCGISLDIGKFLGMTAGERSQMLAGLMAGMTNPVTIDAYIAAVRESTATGADDEASAPVFARMRKAWNPRASVVENIDAMSQAIESMVNDAAAKAKTLAEAIRSIQGDVTKIGAVARPVKDLTDERDGLRQAHTKKVGEIARHEEISKTYQSATTTMATIDQEITGHTEKIAGITEEIAKAKETRDAAKTALDAFAAKTPPTPIDKTDRKGREAKSLLDGQLNAKKLERANAQAELDRINQSEIDFARNSHCPVVAKLTCPSAESVSDSFEAQRLPIRERIAEIDRAIEALETAVQEAEEAIKAKEAKLEEKNGKFKDDMKARAEESATLNKALTDAEKVLTAAETRLEGEKTALAQAIERRTKAEKDAADVPPVLDIDTMKAQATTLETQIKDLDREIDKATRANEIKRQLVTKEAEAKKADDDAKLCRSILLATKREAGRMIAASLAPLTSTVDDLLGRMRSGWRLVAAAEDNGVVLLADTGRGAVPFDALGGGYKLMFSGALALALARLQNAKIKIIALDAAEVDADNMVALLDALEAMGGDADNIMVASCHVTEAPAAWTVVRLTKEEVAHA